MKIDKNHLTFKNFRGETIEIIKNQNPKLPIITIFKNGKCPTVIDENNLKEFIDWLKESYEEKTWTKN